MFVKENPGRKKIYLVKVWTTKENHKILVKKVGEYWNYKLLIGKKKTIFPKLTIITTAQMCMKKLRILVIHLVKHIEVLEQ